MSENLEEVWKKWTSQFPKNASDTWWKYILKKYNEDGRQCHNYELLQEKFKELDSIKNYIKNLQAFILAIFLQYLEYSPKDSECHEKNLLTFYKFSSDAEISNDSNLFKDINILLEASAVHSTDEHKTVGAFGETDLHYFLDLDMKILGSSEPVYSQYIINIHREYSILDEATYKKLRKKVLQSFLLIPNIFATKYFRDKYETQARKNIQQELDALKKS